MVVLNENVGNIPTPQFSYERFRIAMWIDKWAFFAIAFCVTSGFFKAAFFGMIINLPFWIRNSPTFFLLRHTEWMRWWMGQTIVVAVLGSIARTLLPDMAAFIAIGTVGIVFFLEFLYSDERQKYSRILFKQQYRD